MGTEGQVNGGRKEIIGQRAGQGVGAARSSKETSNDRGAKGPQWKQAESDEQMNRLSEQRSTTEPAEAKAQAGQPVQPMLPPRVAALRQKLAQEGQTGTPIPLLRGSGERLMRESCHTSRMREICTSGSQEG